MTCHAAASNFWIERASTRTRQGRQHRVTVAGVDSSSPISRGALFWKNEQSLLVVSDLHLEKGSSFAARGVLLPPYDTVATLGRLAAVIARHDPHMVIALGDSFHDRDAHDRLSAPDRDAIAALQSRRDWIWISGNHDPALPPDLGGVVASEVAIGAGRRSRHEPTGAAGEDRRTSAIRRRASRPADARWSAAVFCLRTASAPL